MDKPTKIATGQWSGDYIDVKGYRSNLEMKLDVENDKITGHFRQTVKDIDKPQIFEGEINGYTSENGIQLKLRLNDKQQYLELEFAHEIHLAEAGTFADQALYGVITSVEKSMFGGGVFIAWRFKNQS